MTRTRQQDETARPPSARHRDVRHRDVLRTLCGRRFTVGELYLGRFGRPTARVWLSVGVRPQQSGRLWASFTPDEARLLAEYLKRHADAVDAAIYATPDLSTLGPGPAARDTPRPSVETRTEDTGQPVRSEL